MWDRSDVFPLRIRRPADWAGEWTDENAAAYAAELDAQETVYLCSVTLAKLMAGSEGD